MAAAPGYLFPTAVAEGQGGVRSAQSGPAEVRWRAPAESVQGRLLPLPTPFPPLQTTQAIDVDVGVQVDVEVGADIGVNVGDDVGVGVEELSWC